MTLYISNSNQPLCCITLKRIARAGASAPAIPSRSSGCARDSRESSVWCVCVCACDMCGHVICVGI